MKLSTRLYTLLLIGLLLAGCRNDSPAPQRSILTDCVLLKPLSVAKHPVQPGEWRDDYWEIQESIKDYHAKKPPRAIGRRTTLYVVRLGAFDSLGKSIFNDTKAYLQAFYQLPVAELDPVDAAVLPAKYFRNNSFGPQLQTRILLDSLLPSLLPDSAFALIAFTTIDLYPDEKWNFVFGQASLQQRIGLWSMARLGDYHAGSEQFALCRQRTMNVAAHETGHILGIKHCVTFECYMNGSNSLAESDSQPPWLCWQCLAKLCINRNMFPEAHIRALRDFHRRVTLDSQQIAYYDKALNMLP